MEEQLKQYLAEFVETLKQGGEFVLDQAPLFVHEYLNWAIVSHSIGVLIGSVLLFFGIRSLLFIIREYPKRADGELYDSYSAEWSYKTSFSSKGVINNIVAIFCNFIGVLVFLLNLLGLIKVLLAPRVYLIENIMDLM